MSAPEIITFGCRLNAYESEAIRARVAEAGLTDAVIVNTCAVTGEAVRQSRQAIRKARRANPQAKIIVTGCAAQTEPETYAAMPEVDCVLGNREKLETASYAGLSLDDVERVRVNDIMSVKETAAQFVDSFEGRARAFLQVQNGCDHRCTFCIIPYGRGNSRSVPMGAVVEEARRLVEAGFPEIVLTGVDLTAYGADLPGAPTLGQLVRKLLKLVPELKRLRLSSIDSIEADDDLWRAIAEEERLMPHFHLSVQAGDDMILKRMKRRHSRADTIAFTHARAHAPARCRLRRRSHRGLSHRNRSDVREHAGAGRRGGSERAACLSRSARARARPRNACRRSIASLIKDRAARLRDKGRARLAQRLSAMVGREETVLVEKPGFGRTPCFAPVSFEGELIAGACVRMRMTGASADHLIAAA